MISSAGIIAAGEGRRLKMDGLTFSKPLVPIAGTPLIGHTLRQLLEVGVERVAIIFNETQQECADWVRAHFASLELRILVKTTRSSFESFWRVGRALGPGRHLICTVDSICSPRGLADDAMLQRPTRTVRFCWRLLHSSTTKSHFGSSRNRRVLRS